MTDSTHARRTGTHFDAIESFERELGLPAKWYFGLVDGTKEADWSFVIKVHALVESALTHAIDAHVQQSELKSFVRNLNVGGQFGKLVVATSFKLVDDAQRQFVRVLLALRNRCVHDIRSVGLTMEDYFRGLSEGDQRHLLDTFRQHFASEELARINLRLGVWLAASIIIAELYDKRELAAKITRIRPSGAFSGAGFGEVGFSE